MKKLLFLSFLFLLFSATAQVQIDKSINLSGAGANAKLSGIKDVSGTTDAVSAEVLQKGRLVYATSVSGSNDISLNFSPAFSATTLIAGTMLNFKAGAANTGNVRLNVDGLGLTPLFKDVSSNLAPNDIKLNQMVQVIFDGTSFQMLSRTPDAGGTVTQITASAPLTGGIINSSGTIGINQANASTNGYLSSTDWNTFNSKLASEVDGSITNEGSLTVQAGTASTSIISSNTSGSTNVTLSAGTGVSLSESGNTITITNSAPDQTVSLSNGSNISVTGTYPSFTIATTGGVLSGGTANYHPKWSGANSLSSTSLIYDNGTNVGIGTTSISQKLEIGGNGGLGFSGTGLNAADKKLYSPADGDLEWMTHNSAAVHGFAISHQGSKVVYLNTSGNSYLTGGNLGIGTTGPTAMLDVNGSARIRGLGAGYVKSDGSGNLSSSGIAAADIPSGSGNYIQNTTSQQSANFSISGNGTVAGTMSAATYTFPAPTGDPAPVITTRTVPAGQGASGERTELILFHSNDPGNGAGDDLITLRAPSIRLQTYNDAAVGDINNNAGSNDRLFVRYDGNVGIGVNNPAYLLEVNGTFGYGNGTAGSYKSRTETRQDAGQASTQSGFFETDAPSPSSNWYSGASSWQHLLDVRHSNPGNNYALQFAGSFFDQRLFMRKTNNSASTSWSEIHSTAIYATRSGEVVPSASALVTPLTSGTFNVVSGERYLITVVADLRNTGGSGEDSWRLFLNRNNVSGCGTAEIGRVRTTDAESDHNTYHTYSHQFVWIADCSGSMNLSVSVQRFDSDDGWAYGTMRLIASRF